MRYSGFKDTRTDIVLVLQKTNQMQPRLDEINSLAADLKAGMKDDGSLSLILADLNPVKVIGPEDNWTREYDKLVVSEELWKSKWQPDTAIKLAASELIPGRTRRAVVLMTDGTFPADAFRTYGLIELAHYFNNNGILFFAVYSGASQRNEEIEYLCRETGGYSVFSQRTDGISGIVSFMRKKQKGNYTLSYTSRANTDFGRAFVPVEVETRFIKKSGQAQSGYYGPAEF